MDFSLEKSLRNFYMEEWWTKEHAIVCEVDVKREQLEEIFENSHMILRSRVENVFHMCDDLKIPITVLSGGIGNFVEIALSQIKADLSKIKANFMEFDENGVFKGFSSPKIHSGNKANSVKDFKTDAIVLLGDMPSVISN